MNMISQIIRDCEPADCGRTDLWKRGVFSVEWKSDGVIDAESADDKKTWLDNE